MKPTKELADNIYRRRILQARRTPPEDKLLACARLFDSVCLRITDGIRNEHPDADEEEIKRLLLEHFEKLRRLENSRCLQKK